MVFRVSFTRGESSGLAHGVGGHRVGCKSSPLVKLESNCNLDDVSFSHDQCPKKDGGVAENLVRANDLKSKNPLSQLNILLELTLWHYQLLTERRLYQGLHQRKYTHCEAQGCGPIMACEVIVYEEKYSSCVVSAGWSAFARDNTFGNLKNMNVNLHRVVQLLHALHGHGVSNQ
ncbi:hypothetical protein CFP56_004732 [Quercus suber]|uniref:Uncharacterized protein n=1 Tax=Quercus suber TaxID=58331 RepID=A0AAW0M8B6_QUESU